MTRRALTPGIALFALVAAAMLAVLWLVISTVDAEGEERKRIAATEQIITALRDVTRATTNAETGQRGYFITLDREYLAPYELGREQFPLAIKRLRTLVAANHDPQQAALVDEIERFGTAKFAELDASVTLIAQGRVLDAQVAILSDRGQEQMSRFRSAASELEARERAELERFSGQTAALEARIVPLLALLVAVVLGALGLGLWQVIRSARAEERAAQAEELEAARDRADILAGELNHRIKNLFAVILAIVRMTGRDDPAATPVVEKITSRIRALLTAHEVTQGKVDHPVVDLGDLIQTAIAPYCSDSEGCETQGGPLLLPAAMAVPLGLVLHELVTNAVKYGAWAGDGGHVRVEWGESEGLVRIVWREEGDILPEQAGRIGFGSKLIDSSARQLSGTIERTFNERGIEVRIEFPAAAA